MVRVAGNHNLSGAAATPSPQSEPVNDRADWGICMEQQAEPQKPLLTVVEAAAILEKSRWWIYRKVKRGIIPPSCVVRSPEYNHDVAAGCATGVGGARNEETCVDCISNLVTSHDQAPRIAVTSYGGAIPSSAGAVEANGLPCRADHMLPVTRRPTLLSERCLFAPALGVAAGLAI